MNRKISTLLLVVLIVGFLGSFGYAQDTAVQTKESDGNAENGAVDNRRFLPGGLAGLAIVNKDVRSTDGENIGTVDNVILGDKTESIYVVVSSGGFLGMGEASVAVPFDKITNTGQDYVVFEGTKADLETYDRVGNDWWNPYGRRARFESRYYGPGPNGWMDPYDPASYRRHHRRTGYYGPYDPYYGYHHMMTHPGELTAAQREALRERRTQQEARRKQLLENRKNYWAELKKQGDPYAAMRTGKTCADQSVRVSEVVGAPVVNRQGEPLGKVDDLIIGGRDGFYAIIGVGGFLGVGEHLISVPVKSLEFAANKGFIYDATKEEITRHPSFDYEVATSCGVLANPRATGTDAAGEVAPEPAATN